MRRNKINIFLVFLYLFTEPGFYNSNCVVNTQADLLHLPSYGNFEGEISVLVSVEAETASSVLAPDIKISRLRDGGLVTQASMD